MQVFAPANTLPARSEAAAVQPVIGISQRVRMNSKEKKDLGTLGMTVPPPLPLLGFIKRCHLLIGVWLMGPCVLSLAGYVLGITMMVIIIAIGAGIILGYSYKRSVASLLGPLERRRGGRYTKSNQTLWLSFPKGSKMLKISSRCRDLVLVFIR